MSARPWLVASMLAAAAFGAYAIEPPQPGTPAPADQQPPAPEPAESAAPPAEKPADETAAATATEDDEELPPLPAATEPAGPPPQRFDPTEKVRADFPVSFPIDI